MAACLAFVALIMASVGRGARSDFSISFGSNCWSSRQAFAMGSSSFSNSWSPSRAQQTRLLRCTLHQRPRDVGMDALATATQNRGVGRVLHQRVLEDVSRLRRRAATVDQFGRHELAESALQRRPLDRRCRLQQAIGELAPDRGGDLRDLLHRREAVKPRHERILQGRGDRERNQRRDQDVAVVLLAQQAGSKNRFGQFFHKQRHPVGLGDDLLQDFTRKRLVAGDAIDQSQGVPLPKAAERKRGHIRSAHPWRGEFWPERYDQ